MIIRQADGSRVRADELADDPNLRGRAGATGRAPSGQWGQMTDKQWQEALADLRWGTPGEPGKAGESGKAGGQRWQADEPTRHTEGGFSGHHVGGSSDKQEDEMTVNTSWAPADTDTRWHDARQYGLAEERSLDDILGSNDDSGSHDNDDLGWAAYLDSATHKELATSVRSERFMLKQTRDRDGRKAIGMRLYDLQVTLKHRFNVDIAKVKDIRD